MREHEQAQRAARSYARNRELRPKIEERLARAEVLLTGYLLRTGQRAIRLGGFQVELRDGQIEVTAAPPDGWEQDEIEWEEESS